MISSPHHSWVLQSQTSTQKRTYRHTRHMIRWQIHTTKTLSLAWGSVASSSFQPCVLNKHSGTHTDTQTKLNTDNPHLRTRLLFPLPTMSFKHWYNKKPNKNTETHTEKHTDTNLKANLAFQLPLISYKHWHKEHNNRNRKNTQRLTWRPISPIISYKHWHKEHNNTHKKHTEANLKACLGFQLPAMGHAYGHHYSQNLG